MRTGHRFLGIVFTVPEVIGEDVQLDHHITPVQFIVTPTARKKSGKLIQDLRRFTLFPIG